MFVYSLGFWGCAPVSQSSEPSHFLPSNTSGLVHGVDASYGTSETVDQAQLTSVADPFDLATPYGVANATAGGVVFEKYGWFGIEPALMCEATGGNARALVKSSTFLAGTNQPMTGYLLWRSTNNGSTNYMWCAGIHNGVSNHYVVFQSSSQRLGLISPGNFAERVSNDYSQYTKYPFPQIAIWTLSAGVLTIYANGQSLTLSSTAAGMTSFAPTHMSWGARLDTGVPTGTTRFWIRAGGVYNRFLSGPEIATLGYELAEYGHVPEWGRTIAQAAL